MYTFSDIIGHEDIAAHLKMALEQKKISHAYIFSGEEGCGKLFTANIFAAALQCDNPEQSPCTKCKSCLQASSFNHPDIKYVTHDKTVISVDDVRNQINSDIGIKPYVGPYKVYIVDEAEKMNEAAQNAILKTIEEPPEYAVILLLTNQKNVFLQTIRSRCVTLDFKTVPKEKIKKYLMEQIKIPDYRAEIAAEFASGNLGKAIRFAESDEFIEIKQNIVHLMKYILETGVSQIGQAVKYFSDNKAQVNECLDLMYLWFRDVLVFKATQDANMILYKEEIPAIKQQANQMSFEWLNSVTEAFQTVKARMKANVNLDVAMELLLIQMNKNQVMASQKGEK